MNTTIRKEFVDTFNKLTHKLSPWEVWKDFVVMCSCSFSNALDKSHYCCLHCGLLTVKEMKRKNCLGKQCRHLKRFENHEYWRQRRIAKERKNIARTEIRA